MGERSTIEIFRSGHWVPAADFTPAGKGPYTGIFEYRLDYVFGDEPLPISLALPISSERSGLDQVGNAPNCPAFLLDLVPQGRGREYLVKELGIPAGDESDLVLAQYGAFNPIGNIRLDTAVRYYQKQTSGVAVRGFTINEILSRKPDFLEHIFHHAMLHAGTSGVQGAAPKFLLTQDADGRWFADNALPDDEAMKHWLVKLPRGTHETDVTILRNELAYLQVARQCGLRSHGTPMLHDDMLFVERFDRAVTEDGLQRLHQESLASLAGIIGFGARSSLFDLCDAIRRYTTNPVREISEFIKRDILNLAMRNTDNHARNTAVQRLPNGEIRLTPVFDVAPMYLDREMIVRSCRWKAEGKEVDQWADIIDTLNLGNDDKLAVAANIRKFLPEVSALERVMLDCGVDQSIIDDCKQPIEEQVKRLDP
jgi:serine/threonine-protein kinase HipA